MRTRIIILAVMVFLGANAVMPAYAASVSIPTMAGAKRVVDSTQIGANKFKPSMCAGITLTSMIVVTGASGTGTNAGELIIGNGSRDQTLNGSGGNDCIIASGAGTWIDNTLSGGAGNDVLIGGKYADNAFSGGNNTDTCYYRSSDNPANNACETLIYMP